MPATTSAPDLAESTTPFPILSTRDVIGMIAESKGLNPLQIIFEECDTEGYTIIEERLPLPEGTKNCLGISLEWSDWRTVDLSRHHGVVMRLMGLVLSVDGKFSPQNVGRGPRLTQFFQSNAIRCVNMPIVKEIVSNCDKEELGLRVEVVPTALNIIEVGEVFEMFCGESKVAKQIDSIKPSIFNPDPHSMTRYVSIDDIASLYERWTRNAEVFNERVANFIGGSEEE